MVFLEPEHDHRISNFVDIVVVTAITVIIVSITEDPRNLTDSTTLIVVEVMLAVGVAV